MNRLPTAMRGAALLAAAAAAWGGMFPVVKPLIGQFDPVTLTVLRYLPAPPVFLALLWLAEGRRALSTEGRAWRLWWIGTVGFAGFGLLAFIGVQSTRPEHAAVIPALMPLIGVVVVALRQRAWPAPRALAAVATGLLGVALAVTHGDPRALLRGEAGGGELLVLAGATCWVFYTLGAAQFPGWSGLRYTALTATFGTLSLLAAGLVALSLGTVRLPDAAGLAAAAPGLGYLLAISTLAVLAWNGGIRMLGAARGVLFINLVPVTAFAIAIAGGRHPGPAEIAGVALVIAALMLNSLAPAAPAVRALPARG